MPTGTPYTRKCPKCKRGAWRNERAVDGVESTNWIECKRSTSGAKGHGGGGPQFRGHRAQMHCRDCGHRWFSLHPQANRKRCYGDAEAASCAACVAGTRGETAIEIV